MLYLFSVRGGQVFYEGALDFGGRTLGYAAQVTAPVIWMEDHYELGAVPEMTAL